MMAFPALRRMSRSPLGPQSRLGRLIAGSEPADSPPGAAFNVSNGFDGLGGPGLHRRSPSNPSIYHGQPTTRTLRATRSGTSSKGDCAVKIIKHYGDGVLLIYEV
jgi:hypothetical protein